MAAQHTPGPWGHYAHDGLIIVNSGGCSLGEMRPGDPFISPDEAFANACLTVASPDLLTIAKRVVEWMRAVDDEDDDSNYLNGPDGWNDMRETAAMAAFAIAKAEDRS